MDCCYEYCSTFLSTKFNISTVYSYCTLPFETKFMKGDVKLNSRISDLRSLAKDVCKEEGVEESDFRGGGRRKELLIARRIFCQIAVKKMGYSGADAARFLGITTSAVNRLAVSDELFEIMKFL